MKSKKEIRNKVFELIRRAISEKKADKLRKHEKNCKNVIVDKDGEVLFCSCKLSNGQIGRCHGSESCNAYVNANTTASIKEEVIKTILNPASCGEKYPKICGLMWVIEAELIEDGKSLDDTVIKETIFSKIADYFRGL